MSISSISNSYVTQQAYSVKNTNQTGTANLASKALSTPSGSNSSDTIDFSSMTENQFRSLVSSGKINMSNDGKSFLIMSLPQGIGTNSGEHYQDSTTKFDYLKRYSNAISSSTIFGFDTASLQNVLDQMEALQGKSYPEKVDSYV